MARDKLVERLIVATSVSTMSTYELDGLELEAKQKVGYSQPNEVVFKFY